MSKQSVDEPVAVADTPNPVATPHSSQSGGESVQEVPQQEVAEPYKTLQLLKEWPIVLFIMNKGQQAYSSVKHSSKVTEAGLKFSEKLAATITASSGNVIQKLRPVWKLVDYSATEGLERLQKFFPVVKESPEKIYDTVVERVVKFISPAVNIAVSITDVGRRQVKKTTKTVIKSSRKAINLVDNRLERLEKYIAGTKAESATVASAQAATPPASSPEGVAAAGTWSGKLEGVSRATLSFAASASLFGVGASFWLLERLPLVGGCFAEVPAKPPRASKPSTASRRASTASYHSLAEELAADQGRALLPPQLAQATQ